MGKLSKFGAAVVMTMAIGMVGSSDAFAQRYFEVGLKAGVAFSKLSGSNLENTEVFNNEDLGGGFTGTGTISASLADMKTGFLGGGYATLHVNERFGVRLEALYTMKGGKGDDSGSIDVFDSASNYVGTFTIDGTNNLSLDYFEIPILAVASFPAGASSTFEIFAGPGIAFRTAAKSKTELTLSLSGNSQTQSQSSDVSDSFKGTDFVGVLGAGMSFKVGAQALLLEARWTPGFTEIDDTGSGQDWKNNGFAISAGVGFPLATTAR